MHLHADDDLPVAGRAFDPLRSRGGPDSLVHYVRSSCAHLATVFRRSAPSVKYSACWLLTGMRPRSICRPATWSVDATFVRDLVNPARPGQG